MGFLGSLRRLIGLPLLGKSRIAPLSLPLHPHTTTSLAFTVDRRKNCALTAVAPLSNLQPAPHVSLARVADECDMSLFYSPPVALRVCRSGLEVCSLDLQ